MALLLAFFVECSVHLTRAKDDTVDLIRLGDGLAVFGVADDVAEVGVASEVFDI